MAEWWRNAVVYQVYVRSFADSNGDGVGDLDGIRSRLPYLRRLGVDAIWLTPFYSSPGVDHGYDVADYVNVDPQFGTLDDFDALVADAHELQLRLIVDIVPNHTSNEHAWFREAISSPDNPYRARYVFRPGRDGGPPNNWPSNFGGPAWTLDPSSGEYYLHLFAPEQPDLDWHNPDVQAEFEDILRFWLDRGIDGFRIDVANGLFKDPSLRDEPELDGPGHFSSDWRRSIDQPEVHPLYRGWRRIAEGYPDDRVLVGEVAFSDAERIAAYVRPGELHLAFNFALLFEPWEESAIRTAIDASRNALDAVGATSTWVLENHDVTRLPTRYGGGERGQRRARAAALLLYALPGRVFVYEGQELGLEEVDVPDPLRQDPVFFRTNGAQLGRDGCRVPMPWERSGPALGFSSGTPWLPQPAEWAEQSVEAQLDEGGSSLELHRAAIALRRESEALLHGAFAWRESAPGTLVFERTAGGETIVCAVNLSAESAPIPEGELLATSEPGLTGELPPDTAAWVREER